MVLNTLNKFKIYNTTNSKLDIEIRFMKKVLKEVLKKEKIKNARFSVIIITDSEIKAINKKYRKIDKPTDVISFALEENQKEQVFLKNRVLGDIYISLDKAKKQAIEYGHSLRRELCFLAVHGLLHLLGYDHNTKEEEKIMFKKQELILDGKRLWNVKKEQKKFKKIY